jgi:hypothetical protein
MYLVWSLHLLAAGMRGEIIRRGSGQPGWIGRDVCDVAA